QGLRIVVSDSCVAGLVRTDSSARIMAFAMNFERTQRAGFYLVSQTGIRYRESPLSQSLDGLPGSAPRAGDRFPWLRLKFQKDGAVDDLFRKLDDTRFNLVAIGQPSPPELAKQLGDLLRIHAI